MDALKYWFVVRETANQSSDVRMKAVSYWLDGEIITNPVGFPVGRPLRKVAEDMAEAGYCNGKGNPYHPFQLQEMIYDGMTEVVASLLTLDQLDLFHEQERPTLTDEQRATLRETIEEACRQKVRYSQQ